jgi:hypothetical protein
MHVQQGCITVVHNAMFAASSAVSLLLHQLGPSPAAECIVQPADASGVAAWQCLPLSALAAPVATAAPTAAACSQQTHTQYMLCKL